MTVYIENEQNMEIPFDYEALLNRIIQYVTERENCPYEAEVSVVITDDTAIHEANLEFRQIDRATDVLSFPMCTYEAPGDFDILEEQDVFHPETGELLLGDIMISYEHVQKQSEEYGHSLIREFAFLTVHSMLHLFGYDHETEEERVIMEELQEKILTELNITRESGTN